jgi:hypothetical protein
MELKDTAKRINNLRRLERLEDNPVAPYDPSEGMEDKEELQEFIRFLYALLQEEKSSKATALERLDEAIRETKELRNLLKSESEKCAKFLQTIDSLMKRIADDDTKFKALERTVDELTAEVKVSKKHLFGSSSQKGKKAPAAQGTPSAASSDNTVDRQQDEDEFDGTNRPKPAESETTTEEEKEAKHPSGVDSNRKGSKYQKMKADEKVLHRSNRNLLPEGATYLWTETRKSFEQVLKIVEHDYEVIVYLDANGKIQVAYLPDKADENYVPVIDKFPGTHASADFLANLVFNKYRMETPFYREMIRVWTQNMSTCRQTLMNWTKKPCKYLMKVVEQLKNQALQPGSVVNCDETWARLVLKATKKVYIWCLVNEAEKIVLFFYDKGSRSRSSLKEFLGDAKIDAFQSDAYNVYMYLDDEVIDVDHLCCMAHVRAKWAYALEQGGDERVRKMLDYITKLYGMEERYRSLNLSPEQIQIERNNKETLDLKEAMRKELDKFRTGDYGPVIGRTEKAMNYMHTFWDQIFLYLKDGRYTIDNLAAERAIRPLTIERKNSNLFCSHGGAEQSALYHTIIATCVKQGYSVLEYLKAFFRSIIMGRRDYENLMPATIGIQSGFKKL